jgi:EAL domain-containing protein (putative c-di-GMP-specific phosphodiesterase class I)
VAEGIETEGELRVVKELGARYAQGFFLGRPSPIEAIRRQGTSTRY